MTAWCGLLRPWASFKGLSVQRSELGKFIAVLQKYLNEESCIFAPLAASRPSSPTP